MPEFSDERKQQLIKYLNKKYEALDFWKSLLCCVKEARAKVEALTGEIEAAKKELRQLNEPKQYGLYAVISEDEYCEEIKDEVVELMKEHFIAELEEGLFDWNVSTRSLEVLPHMMDSLINGAFLIVGDMGKVFILTVKVKKNGGGGIYEQNNT